MANDARRSSDAEGLDYLYHAFRRIHRLAKANVPANAPKRERFRAGVDTLFSSPRPGAAGEQPTATLAQAVVSAVTARFAAGMIVTFGGKPMVDRLGRMVNHAARKRRKARSAE